MKIAISGANGLVGKALAASLRLKDVSVCPVRRVPAAPSNDEDNADEIEWEPDAGLVKPQAVSELDAFVHLAGYSIGNHRWNASEKKKIRSSRVEATRKLAEQIAELPRPPKAFICASATGIYGERGSETLTEESSPGAGFLAEVAQDWEAACSPLVSVGIRVCHARFGIVLAPEAGALRKMLPIFRGYLGAPLGGGRQYWSWISINDCVAGLEHLITSPESNGIYNLVAPTPETNREFSRKLASALRRPLLPAPGFATRIGLRLALGEMADELLLTSCRVVPNRLIAEGFAFQHPQLEDYLSSVF